MATNETVDDRLRVRPPIDEVANWAVVTLAALAVFAALVVGSSTAAALGAGPAGLVLGVLTAVAVFTGAVAAFEVGRTVGTDR